MSLLLASLALVESNNNPNAVGKLGEVGACQMLPVVWKQNRASVLCRPTNPECSFFAAANQLHRITASIRARTGKDPTLPEIACEWNYGHENCRKHGFRFAWYPKCVRDYAWRVSSVYQDTEHFIGLLYPTPIPIPSHSHAKPKTRKP